MRRVWRGLLLAAFMNTQSAFYYRMLSNFMGQGDKETFPFALLATNASFHLIATPVGSVGLQKCACCASRLLTLQTIVFAGSRSAVCAGCTATRARVTAGASSPATR